MSDEVPTLHQSSLNFYMPHALSDTQPTVKVLKAIHTNRSWVVCKRSSGWIRYDNHIHITQPSPKYMYPIATYDRILVTRSSSTSRDHMPDEVRHWRTKRCN